MDYKELINASIEKLKEFSERFDEIDKQFKESKDFTKSFKDLQELQENVKSVLSKLRSIPLPFRGECGREIRDILYHAERRASIFITEIQDLKNEITHCDDFNLERIIGIMYPNQEDRDEYYNDF